MKGKRDEVEAVRKKVWPPIGNCVEIEGGSDYGACTTRTMVVVGARYKNT